MVPLKRMIPEPMRALLRRLRRPGAIRPGEKGVHELQFWESWVQDTGPEPETDYYRKFMMDMGHIDDVAFFDGKVCLDIGCGPKGSLTWLSNAKAAIGLDPLVESYMKFGIARHNMLYLAASAERIPLPSGYVDVLFSMNSLDHVDDLDTACAEIRRVLKPGKHFIASLNLNEPATATEPWTLTEPYLRTHLFAGWIEEFAMIRPRLSSNEHFGPYAYFYEECPPELLTAEGPKAMWCRFRKPEGMGEAPE